MNCKKGVNKIEIMEKIGKKCCKSVKRQIFVKYLPILAQIISGTECDRDKLIFLQKEWVNEI